jgi:serine/threonine-protein kinase
MAAVRGPGTAVAGWQLLRPLGTGSQSEVWLARRGEQVAALKLQPLPRGAELAAAAEAFLHAAELARGLQHPAIVAVWEAGLAGADGALAWLAMEPVPGVDLQRYGRGPRLLPEPVVLHVLQRVAAGLVHAHAHGVVHRDLKPANVLVNWADDAVRIVDFGLAWTVGSSPTGTGIVPGTPAYMAPSSWRAPSPTPAATSTPSAPWLSSCSPADFRTKQPPWASCCAASPRTRCRTWRSGARGSRPRCRRWWPGC